jgi:hypothetical protein
MHGARCNTIEDAKPTRFASGQQPVDSGMMAWRSNDAKSISITTHKNPIDCVLDSTRCTTSSLEGSGTERGIRMFDFLDSSLPNNFLLDLRTRNERDTQKME